jgi:hypothetical protein
MAAQNYEWLTETVPNMKYILNVTSETSCYYEKEDRFVYKRIAVSHDDIQCSKQPDRRCP